MFCIVHFVASIYKVLPLSQTLFPTLFYQFSQNYVHFPRKEAFLAHFLSIFFERDIIFIGKLVRIIQEVNFISNYDPTFRLNNSAQSKEDR